MSCIMLPNPRRQAHGSWLPLILGSSLSYIDSNAVNVPLPVLQRDLHTTAAAVQ